MFGPFINKVIRVLVLGDIMFFSAFGLIGPIFAIFVTKQIAGATIATVGFAATLNLLTKAILQMPVARYIDRHKGEKDDFKFMVAGSTMLFSRGILTGVEKELNGPSKILASDSRPPERPPLVAF
ncbi:MAG: hypothetical protein UV39_C0014G0011 [Candidatus Azambacteria bacterium GW2011_GWA2_42_62]|nr:MAG: hypothetical protein UV39_C0014G0011 [Candidatus Azambacteria bacterium GW2011_GWA2_42_62]